MRRARARRATFERGRGAALAPHKIDDTLAFMFETPLRVPPDALALETPALQRDYDDCWSGFRRSLPRED